MKSAEQIADELESIIDERDMPVFFTMTWPQFLERCERKKWRDSFAADLQEEALNRGFIIGYGNESCLCRFGRNRVAAPYEIEQF